MDPLIVKAILTVVALIGLTAVSVKTRDGLLFLFGMIVIAIGWGVME